MKNLKDICQTMLSISPKCNENDYNAFIDESKISLKTLEERKKPLFCPRQWSQTEINLLISVIKEGCSNGTFVNSEGEIKWNVVSEYMLGRDPTSCKNKWDQLKRKIKESLTF